MVLDDVDDDHGGCDKGGGSSSATNSFGHFHLVHFKVLNTATAMIFVIFNLFYFLKKK